MKVILNITILLVFSAAGVASRLSGGQARPDSPDRDGVQEAIRFERAKDAAAARQARLDAEPTRKTPETKKPPVAPDEPTLADGGVESAIRFERAKDAAAARQARLEAGYRPAADSSTTTAWRHPAPKR